MRKMIIIVCIAFASCINKVGTKSNSELPATKCLDGIAHREYYSIDEVGILYYFYIPIPDPKTKFYKLCEQQ